MTYLFAVLPILPSLVGLLSLLPALAAGAMSIWLGRRSKTNAGGDRRRQWTRFWIRQVPSLLAWFMILYLGRWAWVRMATPTIIAQQPGRLLVSHWSMPRGGRLRTGVADADAQSTRLPTDEVEILWRFQPPGTAFYSDPLPYGDLLLIVGSRETKATVFALEQTTGEIRWTCRPKNYRATVSSPVVADGILYVGEGLHYTRNARIIAIALQGEKTGRVLWTHQVAGHIECSPTVVDGHLYFAAGDDGVYCLRLSEKNEAPQVAWHVQGEQLPDVDTSVTVHDGRVYVGLGTHGNALAILEAKTGAELGRWATPAPVRALPAISDANQIAFVAGEGDFVNLGDSQGYLQIRSLTATTTDFSSSESVANIELPGIVLGAVATHNDNFVVACSNGHLYCISADGNKLGEIDCGAPMACALISTPEVIVGHNRSGIVFGIDPFRWQQLWQVQVGAAGNYVSSPVAVDGKVFMGMDDGVVCLGRRKKRDANADGSTQQGSAQQGSAL